jgi:hypothetical protein
MFAEADMGAPPRDPTRSRDHRLTTNSQKLQIRRDDFIGKTGLDLKWH